MKKFVSLDKQSKKARKEYYSKRRGTWGDVNPVTRSMPSGKTYNRKKDKDKMRKIGRESTDGFKADFFVCMWLRQVILLSVARPSFRKAERYLSNNHSSALSCLIPLCETGGSSSSVSRYFGLWSEMESSGDSSRLSVVSSRTVSAT